MHSIAHSTPAPKDQADLKKVTVELPPADWHDYVTETMWAKPINDRLVELRSVPFYARGLSFGDVVRTKPGEPWEIVGIVVTRSGHSTYRVFADLERFGRRWPILADLRCTFERADSRLVSIDVPAEADIWAVYRALEDGERAGDWDFEEGHCGHPT